MFNKTKKSIYAFAVAVAMVVLAGCQDVKNDNLVPQGVAQTVGDSVVASPNAKVAAFTCGPFSGGYCTDWCSLKFNEIVSPSKKDWGDNAGQWYQNAKDKGWETSTDVTKGEGGAIAVWAGGGFGHVARCLDNYKKREEKNAKGKVIRTWYITVDEYNWATTFKQGDGSKAQIDCYKKNAITLNYGVQTSTQIESDKLARGSSFTFVGYIFPRKIKKK